SASNARRCAGQPTGFGEFRGGTFGLAFEAIARSEEDADLGVCRIGVTRLFEPADRLVNPRLHQTRAPDDEIRKPDIRIVRLRRMACSVTGTASSIDPVKNLQFARPSNAPIALGLDASTVSYSRMASSHWFCMPRF